MNKIVAIMPLIDGDEIPPETIDSLHSQNIDVDLMCISRSDAGQDRDAKKNISLKVAADLSKQHEIPFHVILDKDCVFEDNEEINRVIDYLKYTDQYDGASYQDSYKVVWTKSLEKITREEDLNIKYLS